ncbi:DUF2007 domain-containing protein [uncultured Cytophaga sp.]|uniref:putative signal transducing protein n=1 Tax=uncultured Cytophaga sp. TaxID=160238 RepID=UPI00261DA109|nr:DUF2007 domain-containing protein [uncultured Cytophaga sp.]
MNKNNMVNIKTFNNIAEATIIKNVLSLQGIESFVENENIMGLNPSAGVQLKVLETDEIVARELLSKV